MKSCENNGKLTIRGDIKNHSGQMVAFWQMGGVVEFQDCKINNTDITELTSGLIGEFHSNAEYQLKVGQNEYKMRTTVGGNSDVPVGDTIETTQFTNWNSLEIAKWYQITV